MQTQNPLAIMPTEELRRLSREDPNPIVRFACLREEGDRTNELGWDRVAGIIKKEMKESR